MESISNDYSISIQNNLLSRINALLDGDYLGVYKFDKQFLIAICLTYFGLSENDIITTDKANTDAFSRHTFNIDYMYLYNFFADNSIDFHKHSRYASDKALLLSIIRNGLFHGMSSVDTLNEIVHINNNHEFNEMNSSIPFSFFENYLRSKLTNRLNIDNNSFYLFTAYKNVERFSHSNYNSSSADYLINNGLIPLKVTPKRSDLASFTLESAQFQKFMYYFENYFSHNNTSRYSSFIEYYSDFKVEFEKEFYKAFPGYSVELSIDIAPYLDTILFNVQKQNIIRNSFELAYLLNRTIYTSAFSMYDLLPTLYQGTLKLAKANTALSFDTLGMEEDHSYSLKDDAQNIYSFIKNLRNNKEDVLTTLVTILGTNSMLINGDRFSRDDNLYERLDLKFYTEKEYKTNPDYYKSLFTKKAELENIISVFLQQFKKCESSEGKKRIKEIISQRKSELDIIEKEIKRRNPVEVNLHDAVTDKNEELNTLNANIIHKDNKSYMRTNDSSEIKRIIRNSFAHPGRIRVVKNDSDEYVVEITDVSDSGEITALGYCTLKDLLYFITQDETIYMEHKGYRSAA